MSVGVDPSWEVILTEAFLHGAQFGRDLIFSFGPWGFVGVARGNPEIYAWLFWARLLLAVALVGGSAVILTERVPSKGIRWLWMALIVTLGDPESLIPMILLIAVTWDLPADRPRTRRLLIALLALACAMVVWIKFTGFVLVAALCVTLLAQDAIRRKFPLTVCGITGAAVAFWVLARQPLANVPAFLRNSLAIASGYSGNMQLAGPMWQVAFVAPLLLCLAISFGAMLWESKSARLMLAGAWGALFFFVHFKEAFTRSDNPHIWLGLLSALLPGALLFTSGAGFLNRPPATTGPARAIRSIAVATPFYALTLIELFLLVQLANGAVIQKAILFGYQVRSVFKNITPARRAASYQSELEYFRKLVPLGSIPGTVDFFPDDVALLYANGVKPTLRPVPQGYAAYTPYLSKLNADFLEGASRPESIVFDVDPTDDRYATQTDPLSILAMLRCYEPGGSAGKYLLLRATACSGGERRLISESTAMLGERIPIPPASGPIWAEFEIGQTAAGSLMSLLFRVDPVQMTVDNPAKHATYTITRDISRTGFLLSPPLPDRASFARFYQLGAEPGNEVSGFSINVPPQTRRFYNPLVRVRLYTINLPRRNGASQSPSADPSPLRSALPALRSE